MKSDKQTNKSISSKRSRVSKCKSVDKKRAKINSLIDSESRSIHKDKIISDYKFSSLSSVYNLYKNSSDGSRIPRCSTGFDNRIPGYFNTNFGKMVYDFEKLYEHYDLKIFEYFDGNALDLQSIKKSENEIYLNLFFNDKCKK